MTASTTMTSFHPHRDEEIQMRLINTQDDIPLIQHVNFDRVSLQALGIHTIQLCDRSMYARKIKDIGCSCCQKRLIFYDKHNCRVCGDVVCGQCSIHRLKSNRKMKSIRTCNKCIQYNLQLFNQRLQDKTDTIPIQPKRRRAQTDTIPSQIIRQVSAPTIYHHKSKPLETSNALKYAIRTITCGLLMGLFLAMNLSIDMALLLCAIALVLFLCFLQLSR